MARNGENLPLAGAFCRPLPRDRHQLFKLHTQRRQHEMLQRFVTVHACAIRVKEGRPRPLYVRALGRRVKTTSFE